MNFLKIFVILTTLAASLQGQDDNTKKLWIDLSAKVQNTHDAIRLLDGGSPDPSTRDHLIKPIDIALDRLVKAGELQSQKFEIKIPGADKTKDLYDKKIVPLKKVIEKLEEEYGIYTAMEMCDFGARLHFDLIKPNTIHKMHIRLPAKEMKSYVAHLKKVGLIEKIPELAKTKKPTKPLPYKGGQHWFSVESYANRVLLVINAYNTADKYSHLPYKFGSANPSNGGFDCSGATSYVMKQTGLKPPRTSAQQFIWLRDQGKIHLIGKKIESLTDPAFNAILPGDLVFWSGTYTPTDGRTVKISHVGIYLGTEKDGRHIMACATNGRSYRGKKGNGYGIYDFKLPRKSSKATFVGYGSPL